MTPARRMSSAASISAFVSRPGCAFFNGHLLQNPLLKGLGDAPHIRRKPCSPDLAQRQQLVGVDVLALVFGERVEEHGTRARPVGDQRAVTAGAALPAARDPLFDDAAAQIGIDRSAAGAFDRSLRLRSVIRSRRAYRASHLVLKMRTPCL
jgi:hypothetical protein